MLRLGFAEPGTDAPAPTTTADPERAQQLASWHSLIERLQAEAEAAATKAGAALPAPTWPAISAWAKDHQQALMITAAILAGLIVLGAMRKR